MEFLFNRLYNIYYRKHSIRLMLTDQPNSQTNFRNHSGAQQQLRDALPGSTDPLNKECRICLAQSEEGNPFLSPCLCSGSIKYVHQNCLKEWIQQVVQKNLALYHPAQSVRCQLCKSNFLFAVEVRRQCRSCQQSTTMISQNKMEFGLVFFCFIASVLLLVYSIVHLALMIAQGFGTVDIVAKVVIICSIVLSIGTLIFLIPKIAKFFITTRADLRFENINQ